jgi:hypothetical protein
VSLWGLLHVVDKFRCTKPTLFAFNFTIGCCPANLAAEYFKVVLGLLHLFLFVERFRRNHRHAQVSTIRTGIEKAINNPSKTTKISSYLLYRVSELSAREFLPESLDSCQICVGNVLHVGKVHKVSSFFLCTRDGNECITSKLEE